MDEIKKILQLADDVLAGKWIDWDEARQLAAVSEENLLFLLAAADKIRQKYDGDKVDCCAIVNARSGRCSEDCRYCAQSKYHTADVAVYPLISIEEIVGRAKKSALNGAERFAIVTSGKGMEGDREFPKIIAAVKAIAKETSLKICCSLGALTKETALALKAAGAMRYHHNIETSREHYGSVCTTHTYDDRLATIKIAQEAGLEICSGGIIGMGETLEDRMEMAFELRVLGVDSIPINILTTIPGTAFADKKAISSWEILKTFALFKFIAPRCTIRTAGGREIHLRDMQANALLAGVGGMMIGGYLTTGGRSYAQDQQMLLDLNRGRTQ